MTDLDELDSHARGTKMAWGHIGSDRHVAAIRLEAHESISFPLPAKLGHAALRNE